MVHDYKTAGIERAQLEEWAKKVGWGLGPVRRATHADALRQFLVVAAAIDLQKQ